MTHERDTKDRRQLFVRMLVIAYWLALFISTHIPRPPRVIMEMGNLDKLLHVSVYAGLAFLLSLDRALAGAFGWRQVAMIVGLLAGFGILDELTQIPVGRTCDARDWLADLVGSTLGVLLFIGLRALVRKRASAQAASG